MIKLLPELRPGISTPNSISKRLSAAEDFDLRRSHFAVRRTVGHLLFVALIVGGPGFTLPTSAQDDEETPSREAIDFFEKKIRPVLIDHCYACHSSDAMEAGDLQGGLMLDSREAIRHGGDSGPAVVPSKPDESLILAALRYEEFEMPPDGRLDDQTIADFEHWIAEGAADPRDGEVVAATSIDIEAGRDFWSLQPLPESTPTAESLRKGAANIDDFIKRQQSEVGTKWNEPAAPQVLVRRAWFDVLGLPPAPEQLQHWTNRLAADSTEEQPINMEAYEDLLDHLFDSPHYGERWARHWMDVVRFAESHGYEQDYDRPNAYHYRDFLIRAFNSDMPFDQFLKWQLAGDELAPNNPDALMATGFLGAGTFPTQLTEAEFESARYDELDDMVSTIGVAFLGLSVGCARCHDHKFDPIPTRDYYRMASVFTSTIRTEVELELEPEENAGRRARFQEQRKRLVDQLAKYESEQLPSALEQFIEEVSINDLEASIWQTLNGSLASSGGTSYERMEDGSFLAKGDPPAGETLTFMTRVPTAGAMALRLETLTHESLPHNGPGRAPNGNFALGSIRLFRETDAGPEKIKIDRAMATHQQNDHSLSVAASIDEDRVSGWAVDGQIGQDQAAVFWFDDGTELNQGDSIIVELEFHHPNTKHAAGRVRFSLSASAKAPVQTGHAGIDPGIIRAINSLKTSPDDRGANWGRTLDWFKSNDSKWVALKQELDQHVATGPGIQLSKVMICSEGLPHMSHHADGRGYPHFYPETYLLRRGDVEQKVEVVEPGYLSVLLPEPNPPNHWNVDERHVDRTSYRRAALANWIVDTEQGAGALAARVIVNRLWQHHFGRGLVATPNDFGRSGDRPTHPDLLDWMAHQLVASGWKLKPIHKQIMLSRTYMQSSAYNEAAALMDVDNRTWWRREPRRLEAEAIRDAMLLVSGELDETMFGPGTLDPNMKRRSIYFFIKRSKLIPMMMLFDWPEHLVSIGQRSSTTIASQSLMFMNDPFCRSLAASLARVVEQGDADARIDRLFQRCFGRSPTSEEKKMTRDFIASQQAIYEQEGHQEPTQKAWVDLCQSLFSASEFLYVD